nr:MauE/DoxX family redox-associated membrane protein [Pedobacter panaciterrae]
MNTKTMKAEKRWISAELVVDVISYLFVLLFLYAAVSKLIEYDQFKIQIAKSPILTDFATILVWLVPAIEIIIAVLLVIPNRIMMGLYASLTLMFLFTAYIIIILNFSDSIPCSCGGVLAKMGWNEHLIFNVMFIIIAISGILLQEEIKQKRITKKT